MTDRELMQDALDALNNFDKGNHGMRWQVPLIKALRARLAQPEPAQCDGGQCGIGGYCKECPKTKPEPEPVAWMYKGELWFDGTIWHDQSEVTTHKRVAMFKDKNAKLLYTTPPQREWVGLTDEEINILFKNSLKSIPTGVIWNISRTIEAKLKEKNNG